MLCLESLVLNALTACILVEPSLPAYNAEAVLVGKALHERHEAMGLSKLPLESRFSYHRGCHMRRW